MTFCLFQMLNSSLKALNLALDATKSQFMIFSKTPHQISEKISNYTLRRDFLKCLCFWQAFLFKCILGKTR